jgi:hypothetical protein
MRFTQVALFSGLSLLVASIVVPGSSSVNQNTTTDSATPLRVAAGMPLPPLPHGEGTLLADGMPLPPRPPSITDALLEIA